MACHCGLRGIPVDRFNSLMRAILIQIDLNISNGEEGIILWRAAAIKRTGIQETVRSLLLKLP
jgi:hypothetical protein